MKKSVKDDKIAKIKRTKEEYFRQLNKEKELDDLFTRIICTQDPSEKSFLTELYRDRSIEA